LPRVSPTEGNRVRISTVGFSIIECLVALVVFAVGVLGAAGTIALAERSGAEGARAVAAAELALVTLDSLRVASAAGHGCSALAPGVWSGREGTTAQWTIFSTSSGVDVRLVVAYPTVRGNRADTLWSAFPCR
jgi:prepilin-type N-terminal cleavage/methylation domain-containing protein